MSHNILLCQVSVRDCLVAFLSIHSTELTMPSSRRSDDNSGSSSSSSSRSDDDDAHERFVSKRRGWAGEDLELEHQRESLQKHKEKVSAAVDISQFQNHEIGKGYQAKHVVRQQMADKPTAMDIKDMTGGGSKSDSKKIKSSKVKQQNGEKKRKHREEERAKEADNPRTRLKKYLSSAAFVSFRKEIEAILSS